MDGSVYRMKLKISDLILTGMKTKICIDCDNMKCNHNKNTGCCLDKGYKTKKECKKWHDWKFKRNK